MSRTFPRRPRWWLAVVQVVLLLATIAVPAAAATDSTPLTEVELLQILRTYGVVQGDERGHLNLDKPIKRAEMVTIMVRAMGAERDSELYKGFGIFEDAKGHWAEGYLVYGFLKGLVKGDGNGIVRPEDPITYAEALTLTLRLTKKEPTSGNWPLNVLLAAAELGLMPTGVTAGNANEPAVRGLVFQSMGVALTSIKSETGKTFLQTYIDSTPPVVEIASPLTTKDAAIQFVGTARDAVSVKVNGNPVTLSGINFAARLNLEYGDNPVTVEAVDLAGNVTTRQVKVNRQFSVVKLEINGPATVRAGETATYTVTAYDDKNVVVPAAGLTASVSGGIGTFDATKGVLTAGTSSASGSIQFKAGTVTKKVDVQVLGPAANVAGIRVRTINNGLTVPITKPMTIEVETVDIQNQLVATDNGREISLQASGIGLTVTPAKSVTKDGVATFSVIGTSPSTVVVTASSAGVPNSVQVAQFGTATRIVLVADTPTLTIGAAPSYTRIRAELRDENGNLTNNTSGSDIVINLSQSGAVGTLSDGYLTIKRGTSSSNASSDDGQWGYTGQTGQTLIVGTISSGHTFTVDTLTVNIARPSVGTNSRIQILNINPALTPGATATVQLRMLDAVGNPITAGNYAFRIKVDSSNEETKTNGLPAGVSLTIGTTGYSPVDTGAAPAGNYVYGRTVNGSATLQVSYNKSGVITLTPVIVGSVTSGFADDGSNGPAIESTPFTPVSDKVLFAGTPAGIRLTVDSSIGNDQPAGNHSAASSNAYTLRATMTDAAGGKVPGATTALVLEQVTTGFTTAPQFPNDRGAASDGVLTFRVFARANAGGCDTYRVTSATPALVSNTVDLCVRNEVPAEARIITIRGTSGVNNRVSTTDTGMEIELAWKTTGADTWVNAVLYRNGSAIYTSNAFNMAGAAPRVTIPRSVLASGAYQYQIALRNGTGEGPRSNVSESVTVDYESTGVGFYNARYDGSDDATTGHKLIVSAYGLSTDGQIDTRLLVLKDASRGTTTSLEGASWSVTSNSQFVINLGSAPVKQTAVESNGYSGTDVTLEAQAGWYYSPTNAISGAAVTGKPVTPFGDVTGVVFDVVNNQLLISGSGFSTGAIDLTKFSIIQGANTLVLDNTNVANWNRTSDNLIVVNLNSTGAGILKDSTKFNGSDTLNASLGWLVDSGFKTRAISLVPITGKVNVATISYAKRVTGNNATPAQLVIRGSGFFSGGDATRKGTVDLTKLSIRDIGLNQSEALSGAGATYNVVSDGEILITLDDADAATFENTYGGSDIYVVGTSGWFKDFQQRSAADIAERYFRLTINANGQP